MNVRELKDNSGVVFSPKVSTESVYLKGSTTNLDSKLGSMDTTISGKMDNVSLATVATSGSYTDLSNKPNYAGSASEGGLAYSSSALDGGGRITSVEGLNNFIVGNSLKYSTFQIKDTSSGTGLLGDDGMIISIPWTSNTYGSQIIFDDTTTATVKVRGMDNKVWGDWKTVIMSGNTNPDITATGFYVSSSRKVKENIEPTKVSGEDMINSVNVVDFNYIDDKTHAPKVGFIAEDTDPLFSTRERKAMDSANCIGILMKAVQELSSKVKNLTSELDKLTSKVGGGWKSFRRILKSFSVKLTFSPKESTLVGWNLLGKTSSSLSFNYNRLALPMNYRRIA